LTLALAGCSGSQTSNIELPLTIDNIQADAWINMMPGSQQTFFVTGSFRVKNYGDSSVSSINITKCLVSQNKNVIYNLIPVIQDTLGSPLSVAPGQLKKASFSSKGVGLQNEFNLDQPVDLTLYLISAKMTKQVIIPGVKITKAY
jgi:hypothetical protein